MTQYLLSIYQPDGPPPATIDMDQVMAKLAALNSDMKEAGAWIFTGGLHGAEAATVVRDKEGEAIVTDGPYVEGKEHVGGLYVIEAPDLDAALAWAHRVSDATTLPIEVRPFAHGPER